jgi:cytidylate kinase
VVFPEAQVKLFVTAGPEERARRRWAEMQARGVAIGQAQVEAEMRARDAQDAGRSVAPLRAADDAATLDTTGLDIEAAFRQALQLVRARLAAAPAERGNVPRESGISA